MPRSWPAAGTSCRWMSSRGATPRSRTGQNACHFPSVPPAPPSVWSTVLRLRSPLIVRCFGALLTPSGSHRALVRSVADGGMNIMRIWGGGVYQLDAFYDAADEFGVLLYRANTRLNRSALGSCEAVPVDADCGITWTFVEE